MADRRRQYLRQCASHRGVGSSSAFARGDGSDLKEQAGGQSDHASAGTYARDVKYLRVDRRNSIELRLDALRRLAVVFFAAELAFTQFRNDGARRWQALAIDLGGFVPELRAHDRLRAMEIDRLNVNDEYAARQLAVDRKTLHQLWIDGDRSAAIHAQGLTHAGDQKKQRDARITYNIAKAVNAVVAGPVGNGERLVVENTYKAGGIALGRTIEAFGPAGRDCQERRSLDQLAVGAADVVDLLDDRSGHLLAVNRLQLLHGRDQMVAISHFVPLKRPIVAGRRAF